MHTKQVGDLGESIARRYLDSKGYRILAQNYSLWIPGNPRKGEIDIVAQKGDLVVFFEVKTLVKNNGGKYSLISPEQKVDFSKMRKLVRTAESWLMKNKIPLNSKWQIDVLGIEIVDGRAKISHFENAVASLI